MLKIPNVGESLLLGWAVTNASTESFTLKLYKNNYVPVASSVASDFTVANFTGYASTTLSRASWSTITNASNISTVVYSSAQTFTCSGGSPQTIFGYYVVGASSGTLVWAELFNQPRTITSGGSISLTPALTLAST